MWIWVKWGEERARTRKFENRSTERNSKVKMYTVCPEEGQTSYQKVSVDPFEHAVCSRMSPTLATVSLDVSEPWTKHLASGSTVNSASLS